MTWLLGQINNLRQSVGLPPYALNPTLTSAAQLHSQWMADTGMVSHEETNGSTPQSRAATLGYPGSLVSENIYGGGIAKATDAWNFWINSPIHYSGLIHELFNEIGIGIGVGAYGTYYTLVFGNGGVSVPISQPTAPTEQPQLVPQSETVVEEVAPTQPQPSPVWITWTPSATFPTPTATLTWTPTFTWTPSPTTTVPAETATPVPMSELVSRVPTLIPSTTPTDVLVALVSTRSPEVNVVALSNSTDADSRKNWLFILLGLIILQIVIIALVVWFFDL